MGGTTQWVRAALAELGPDAPDAEVKAYILRKDPTVPESRISLALRKIRGRYIPFPKRIPPGSPKKPRGEDEEA